MLTLQSDRDGLFQAICAAPDDDAPRLVYADWLEENGQSERAWLIRFQCDRQNHWVHDGTREYELIERHIEEWFSLSALRCRKRNRRHHDWYLADYGPPNLRLFIGRTLRATGEREMVELPIRRGFIESVESTMSWFWTRASTLFAANPVTKVRLTDMLPAGPDYRWYPLGARYQGVIGAASVILDGLWARLPGGELGRIGQVVNGAFHQHSPYRRYDSLVDAMEALSHACVSYGRSKAGLPPLTAPATSATTGTRPAAPAGRA